MTNDYKQDILDYITNNVTVTQGTNEPQFTDSKVLDKSVAKRIGTLLGGSYSYGGYLNDENTKNIIIYGFYNNNENGFIYMCDSNLDEIQMITTFTSGTKLFPLNDMNVDENGYLYGVSLDQNGTIRVLLFNNIFSKAPNGEYQARLRQSYIVPNGQGYKLALDSIYYIQKTKKIIKVPEEATYYLFLRLGYTTESYVLRFTINVGAENEWVFIGTGDMIGHDCLIEKENDVHTLYLYYSSNDNNSNYYEGIIKEDVFTQIKTITTDLLIEFCFAKSREDIYIAGGTTDATNEKIEKISTNSTITIDTIATGNSIAMKLHNNIIFLYVGGKVGILQNDVPYYSATLSVPLLVVTFFVIVSYNLVNIYVATGTISNPTTTRFTLDYNVNNYNGLEYSDYSQTLATKGRLYSGGELVFARNLYNTTLLGNIATSNLQVPNTLLNGETIVIQDLVGATNGIILHNATTITKNIYETLYVNFIRSLSVIDEDENKEYPLTATYINQNINTATQQNCEDTFIGKVNINYTDSTITQNIEWTYVTDHYETSFVIDATDEVPTIDFLSNDETTIYLTKELDVTSGNYYKVSQKLRIE